MPKTEKGHQVSENVHQEIISIHGKVVSTNLVHNPNETLLFCFYQYYTNIHKISKWLFKVCIDSSAMRMYAHPSLIFFEKSCSNANFKHYTIRSYLKNRMYASCRRQCVLCEGMHKTPTNLFYADNSRHLPLKLGQ